MRGLGLLLAALLVAGCTGGMRDEGDPSLQLLALDGRWEVDRGAAARLVADAEAGRVLGAVVFTEGVLHREGALPIAADAVGMEEAALSAWARVRGWHVSAPESGSVLVERNYAEVHGLRPGDIIELRTWSWPVPLVATFFEMDRTRPCSAGEAKLCFLPFDDGTTTRLRLRVDDGAQDLAFLPDLAELGAAGTPAWWNGTFTGPNGRSVPFSAFADRSGAASPGEMPGRVEAGVWEISFRLEANHSLVPAGVAGIVRIREPGYGWFDDRLLHHETGEAQAQAVLAQATPQARQLRVAAVLDLPDAPAPLLMSLADAQALEGVGVTRVGGLLVEATPEGAARLAAAQEMAAPAESFLRLRPLFAAPQYPPQERVLLFRAPAAIEMDALPSVEGSWAPTLAVGLEAPVGQPIHLDGAPLPQGVRVLAHAGPPGVPPPWQMEAGSRWLTPEAALENLTRARTLTMASEDVAPPGTQLGRLVLGDPQSGRVAVVAAVVTGGPAGVVWAAASLAAGAGEPSSAYVLLPVAEGAPLDAVRERAREAFAPHGLAELR